MGTVCQATELAWDFWHQFQIKGSARPPLLRASGYRFRGLDSLRVTRTIHQAQGHAICNSYSLIIVKGYKTEPDKGRDTEGRIWNWEGLRHKVSCPQRCTALAASAQGKTQSVVNSHSAPKLCCPYFFSQFYLFIFGCAGSLLPSGPSLVAVSRGHSPAVGPGFSLLWLLL